MKNREIQAREGAPAWTVPPGIRVIIPADEWMPWVEVAPLCDHLGIRVPDTLRAKAKTDPNLEFGTLDGVEFATASTAFQLVGAAGGDARFHPFMMFLYRVAMPNAARASVNLPLVESIPEPDSQMLDGKEILNEGAANFLTLIPGARTGRAVFNNGLVAQSLLAAGAAPKST